MLAALREWLSYTLDEMVFAAVVLDLGCCLLPFARLMPWNEGLMLSLHSPRYGVQSHGIITLI